LLVLLAGALTGGFVTGLAGSGTGLVALGVWLYVVLVCGNRSSLRAPHGLMAAP
jgi:hypothetical protein